MSKVDKWEKLTDLCVKITDGSHYSPVGIEKGYPMLSVKDMMENKFSYQSCKYISLEDFQALVKSDCIPRLNDILIAKDGSYLKHVFVVKEEREEAILSSIGILRPNLDLINPYYIKYYLHSDFVKKEVAKKYVSGSALPRIILKNFGEIQVPYRDLPTQQKIASVLSSLDAKIELNNRINAELEAMAKTLYDYWFVQFDFPNADGKPYKSSGGAMVWSEELKREIPEGWEVNMIRTFANTASGGTPLSSKIEYYQNGTITWINSGELNNSYIVTGKNFITEEGLKNSSAKKFPVKTILMAMYGATAGKVSLLFTEACTNQAICGIMPKSENVVNYLKFSLEDLYKYLINLSTGSARDNLSQDKIKDLHISIPPNELLNNFDLIINPTIQKITQNISENQQLAQLRDWLLPMLMNGQVVVE